MEKLAHIKDAVFSLVNIDVSIDDFINLKRDIEWKQDYMTIYGKKVALPRLTQCYGKQYSYSGIVNTDKEIPSHLQKMFDLVFSHTDVIFNTVLLNYYRNGNDSIGWHSDDEKGLGYNPNIASLSFGQSRSFMIKHKRINELHKIELNHGDLLLMGDLSQVNYLHSIPKETKYNGERINLTFRNIL